MYTLQEILTAINNRQHPVQRVEHYDDITPTARKNMQWPAIAEVKYDGVYAVVVMTSDKGIQLISRSGKALYFEVNYLPEWLEAPAVLAALTDGICLISELVNPDISLEALSGMVNPNRVTPWDSTCMLTCDFVVHDAIYQPKLMQGVTSMDYALRVNWFPSVIPLGNTPKRKVVSSEAEWLEFASACIADKQEGAVLKQLHAPWDALHRGWHVTKVVRGVHLDLRCEGWSLGKGKRSNQIAKLYFSYQGKPFSADLGKGWTDDKRDELTARAQMPHDTVTGSIFHVKGLQISSKGVIRLPKVQEERVDKSVADGEYYVLSDN